MRRIPSIDYLKLLLAAGVVLAHSILIQNNIVSWSFLIGNGVLRSLVPAFSVLSGYCLYVTYQRGKARKWILGLIMIYVFWTIFYMPLWIRSVTGVSDVMRNLVWGPMHLWYVAGLIVAGLFLIALLRLGDRLGWGLWPALVLALALALVGSINAYRAFFFYPDMPLEYYRNGLTVIFPFSAAGYAIASYVDRRGLDALPRAGVIWALVAVFFALRLAEAVYAMRYGISPRSLPEFPLFAYPAALLLFLGFLRTNLPQPTQNLSLWSASIYFLHIFVIVVIRHFGSNSLALYFVAGVTVPVIVAVGFERIMPYLRRSAGAKRALS